MQWSYQYEKMALQKAAKNAEIFCYKVNDQIFYTYIFLIEETLQVIFINIETLKNL